MSHLYNYIIAPASVSIPLLLGVRRYKLLNISCRFLIGFLSFSLIGSVLGKLSAYFFHTNILINELYTLGEFPLLAGFYYFQFASSNMRKLILCSIIAFIALCIGLMIVFNNVNRFDDYSSSTEALLLIFLGSAMVGRQNNSMMGLTKWEDESVNWFNTGILLYFSGSLFVFLLLNYFIYTPSVLSIVWNIHATFLIMLSILFTVGFNKVKEIAILPTQK